MEPFRAFHRLVREWSTPLLRCPKTSGLILARRRALICKQHLLGHSRGWFSVRVLTTQLYWHGFQTNVLPVSPMPAIASLQRVAGPFRMPSTCQAGLHIPRPSVPRRILLATSRSGGNAAGSTLKEPPTCKVQPQALPGWCPRDMPGWLRGGIWSLLRLCVFPSRPRKLPQEWRSCWPTFSCA